jgi:MATE family multidrug resistance protein
MLIIYIVQRSIREEVEYLRGLNTAPDDPVPVNSNSGHLTGGNHVPGPSQDHLQATIFTGLGALVFAGVSGVLKSATQLWSKDFGGGEFFSTALLRS